MPLTGINRQEGGFYRCTADNGVGRPATKDTYIIVQCECTFSDCKHIVIVNSCTYPPPPKCNINISTLIMDFMYTVHTSQKT